MLTTKEIESLTKELDTFDLANITNEQYIAYLYVFGKLFKDVINIPRAKIPIDDDSFVRVITTI